jgi:hypothetical protein
MSCVLELVGFFEATGGLLHSQFQEFPLGGENGRR